MHDEQEQDRAREEESIRRRLLIALRAFTSTCNAALLGRRGIYVCIRERQES